MQLNRVNAPNEGAAGIDLTNAANTSGAAAEGREAITMVRTHDVKMWRGVPDKARLRIALPPGKVVGQPIKGGWLGRARHMLQARSERVQEQSAQRQAALGSEQSTSVQAGPKWLRGIGAFRGRLQGLIAKLKERAMPRAPVVVVGVAPVMQTIKAAAAASAAAISNTASSTAKDSVYRTVKTPDPNAGANADAAALAQVTAAVQQRFAAQAGNKEAFTDLLKKAFGDQFDAAKAETIRQQALAGDFSWAPKVQVVDSKALADLSGTQATGSAKGAYVQDTDTIYISRELLHSDSQEAQKLLMEEMGHGIDARINTSDTVGDEGEVFAKLMHGDNISAQEMADLKAENDRGVVNINGKSVAVEYRSLSKSLKKLRKSITGGLKKAGKSLAKGAVNLAKSAVKVTTGLATFNFSKVKEGFKEGVETVKTTAKAVHKAIKDTAKEIHAITKQAFKDLMQSKVFAAVLAICRFIPIPIVQLVVHIVDMVRAAYMVYQGVKNKSLAMVIGGVASLASGAGNVAGSLGASVATVNTIKSVADAASKLSAAYNAVANKDIGAAVSLLGGAVGGSGSSPAMNSLATVGNYFQQGMAIRQAVRSGDALGAVSGVVGFASSAVGGNSPMSQNLADAKQVITGLQVGRELSRGNLDTAQSLAASMYSARQAGQQADATLALQQADEAAAEQAANNRSLLNEADKDLRALPAEQEGAAAAVNAGQASPAATAAAEEHRNGSDVDSDNTAARNGGVGPGSSQTLLAIGKGQTLEGIARAQYGENWKAGLTQMMLDNNIKLNQWGSPILGVGKTLVLNDISGKSEQELASLSRTGGRLISNNDKGLAAKADLEERAREAAALKALEANGGSFASSGGSSLLDPLDPPVSQATGFNDRRDPRDIRAAMASEAAKLDSTVPLLKKAADDFAAKSIQAYNSGDKALGDKLLSYASGYYKAAGEAQQSAQNLSAAAPKFQLPPAAVGSPGADLKFELELGGALYAVVGGNIELKSEINISRPLASGITEFEAGLGLGVGFKGKAGVDWLRGNEPAAAAPVKLFEPYGGQANNTGAISTKFEAEAAVPLLTVTGLEMRAGVQSPLNGVPATDKNHGAFGEVKYLEPKASPFLNLGASVRWDLFNTSYKRSLSEVK
jgi:hypothetical protein